MSNIAKGEKRLIVNVAGSLNYPMEKCMSLLDMSNKMLVVPTKNCVYSYVPKQRWSNITVYPIFSIFNHCFGNELTFWSLHSSSDPEALYLMMKQCFLKSHLPNRTCRSKPKYTPRRAPAPCPFFLDYYKRTIETMYYQHVEIYLSLAAPLGDRHKSLIHPRDNNYVILIPRWSRFRKDNLS